MHGRNSIPTAACKEQNPALWRREALICKAVMVERPVLGGWKSYAKQGSLKHEWSGFTACLIPIFNQACFVYTVLASLSLV